MNIIFEKENLPKVAGGELAKLLSKYSEKAILLMLSGGSAFSMLPHVDMEILPHDLTLSVLDERFDIRADVNNFQILSDTLFFKSAIKNGAQSIDTRVKNSESHEMHAKRFEENLHTWREAHPDGVVIATMGMGGDGHTAGIMPSTSDENTFDELFENKNVWVVSYDAGDRNEFPLRTTVTNSFLRDEVDHALMYVSGESKREVLKVVLAKSGQRHEYPARIIHEMKDLTLVTDIEIS